MNTIMMHVDDLNTINDVVKDNKIDSFRLIYDNSSGIGYTIDIEFDYELHGRDATVRIPITGTENW